MEYKTSGFTEKGEEVIFTTDSVYPIFDAEFYSAVHLAAEKEFKRLKLRSIKTVVVNKTETQLRLYSELKP